MSERFTISRQRGRWFVAYPDGFLANGGTGGVSCPTFEGAVEAFIRKSEAQCPTCLRGAVIDMPWGWKCEACGNYDIATTWTGPEDAA